jgi:hypothetical protein
LREVRPEGRRAAASEGARKPRADRIEIDFSWSDQGGSGPSEPSSRRRTHRSRRQEERLVQSDASSPADPQASEAIATEMPAPAPIPAPTPVDDVVAHAASVALSPSSMVLGGVADVLGASEETPPVRRTVVIRGHGTRGYAASRGGYEAHLRPHERSGFKPDRVALWAVLLGLALLLGAVTSSHAATLHVSALHHLLLHRALIHPAP